ncbi:hypothetical protein H0H81_011612 [Sphagnurus paluster]|uniref:Uncharacterized protein n=1 Tax=Sphagnurus paluster TaxID=117069 RepID=A0A9P7GVG3_9AGAR|nr:hypothetical protein H0H81_011612 [Sphagnurus paluster]
MSSLLLLKHHEVHTIQDDMESFVLLLLYYGLRYLQHTGAFGSSLSIIEHIFDYEGKDENGGTIGGKTKETMFTKANYLGAKFRFHSRPFNAFNRGAFRAIREWIEAPWPSYSSAFYRVMVGLLKMRRMILNSRRNGDCEMRGSAGRLESARGKRKQRLSPEEKVSLLQQLWIPPSSEHA